MKLRIKMSEIVHYQFEIEVDDAADADAINEAEKFCGPQKGWIIGSGNRDPDDWETLPHEVPARGM